VEVSRSSDYFYRIRTWIKKCSGCDISDITCCSTLVDFDNVKVPYNDLHSSDLPNIDRTIELTQANHDLFAKFAWGWRFAAGGGSPENVTISSSSMYFVK
jgi:hypothetical protein